jgi:hypothetical protein
MGKGVKEEWVKERGEKGLGGGRKGFVEKGIRREARRERRRVVGCVAMRGERGEEREGV